jgi:serine/threonine protein kinase
MNTVEKFGAWSVVKRLDAGGQGEVFLVRRTGKGGRDNASLFSELIQGLVVVARREVIESKARDAIDLIQKIVDAPHGALKKLHPASSDTNGAKAFERMARELAVLESIHHPALVRVLDKDLDQRWFVLEFCPGGALNKDLARTKGRVLQTLERLRPVVEAASLLHSKGLVHRDIKPKNIFIRENGDFGLGRLRARDRSSWRRTTCHGSLRKSREPGLDARLGDGENADRRS